MRSALVRTIVCAVLFLGAFGATLGAARSALDHSDVKAPQVGLNLMKFLTPQLEGLARAGRDPGQYRAAFLGDSVSISTRGGLVSVPVELRNEIGRLIARSQARAELKVSTLASLGMGPFDYYFLSDVLADARPDQVVIALSLNSFGRGFGGLARSRLSGWLSARSIPQAASLPIHWIGLTFDDLLMNMLVERVIGLAAWNRNLVLQARIGKARDALADSLGKRYGRNGPKVFEIATYAAARNERQLPGLERYDAEAELRHYGDVLTGLRPDHPVLEVLTATVAKLERAGIETLVYVNPINVEHLEGLGLLSSGALTASLVTIERRIRAAGGDFLDLHGILPDEVFRDVAGHFRKTRGTNATREIARAVAPRVAELAGGAHGNAR